MVRVSRIVTVSLVLIAGLLLTIPAAARADKIKLKDKRVFEGKILSESEDVVEIDTLVTGIRVTMKFKPKDIFEITKEDLPADFFGKPKDKPADSKSTDPKSTVSSTSGTSSTSSTSGTKDAGEKPPAKPLLVEAPPPPPPAPAIPDAKDIGENPYLEVPLKGEFGVDIVPEGIKEALEFASKQPKIKHIVFDIDSPGGRVDSAEEILKTLKQYGDRFEYHIIIRRAISASIWVVFSCDTIHMTDGATVGGAVVFSMGSFGNAEVDAKMNSIVCATVRAEAEHKKHPADLVDAMMIQAATCAGWKDADGKIHVAKTLPKGTPPEQVIFNDDEKRILTLTKDQAVNIELAVPHKGGAETLDKTLGLSGWKKFNDHGQWAMETKSAPYKAKQKAAAAYIARIKELGPYIDQNFEESQRYDPSLNKHKYTFYSNTGRFTDDSKRQWIQDTDSAIAAINRVRKALDEIQDLQSQLTASGLPRQFPELWMKDTIDRCDRDIKRLKQDRTRNGP